MVDDNNKSNKPANSSDKPINGENIFEQIQKERVEKVQQVSSQKKTLIQRAKDLRYQEREMEKLYEQVSTIKDREIVENELYVQAEKIAQAEAKISTYSKTRARNINAAIAGEISTYSKYKNINERTTTMSSSYKYNAKIRADIKAGKNTAYTASEDIDEFIETSQKKMERLGKQIAGQTRGYGHRDEWSEQTKEKSEEFVKLQEEVAEAKHLKKMQIKRGLNSSKIGYSTEDEIARSETIIKGKTRAEDIRSGKTSIEDEFKAFEEALKKSEKSLAHFEEVMSKSSQGLSESAKEDLKTIKQKAAARNIEDTEKLVEQRKRLAEAEKQEREGGGGRGKWGQAASWMGVAGLAARTASTINLDYELEQTNQRAAYANIANRQYKNVSQFINGDMAAGMELMQGDAFAKAYSDEVQEDATLYKGIEAGASVLDAVFSGISTFMQVAKLDISGRSLATAEAAAGQTGGAVQMAARLGMGIEQGAYGLKGYDAGLNLAKAINTIPAAARQTYYDTSRGTYDAGTGLGSRRSEFMDTMLSKQSRSSFTAAGMTAQEAIGLAGRSVRQIGVTEDYVDLTVRAGRAQQRGVMSMDDYTSAVGQLTAVGGGSADLENIMSKAVTVGMENAKNINQMIQASVSLATASAAAGISTVSATEDMMSASIESLSNMGIGKNLAVGAAANALDDLNKASMRKGTFEDLVFRSEAKNIYGNTTMGESMVFAGMSLDQMRKIKTNKEKAYQIADNLGIADKIGLRSDGTFEEGMLAKFEKLFEAKLKQGLIARIGTGIAYGEKKIFDEIMDVHKGNKKAKKASNIAKQLSFGAMGVTLGTTVVGKEADKAEDFESKGFPYRKRYTPGEKEAPFMMQDIVKGLFREQEFDVGEAGMKDVGGMAGLVSAMNLIVKNASPDKMSEAVSEAAKDLTAPASTFSKGADKFDGAVNAFVSHIKSLGVDVPASKEANINKVPINTGLRSGVAKKK